MGLALKFWVMFANNASFQASLLVCQTPKEIKANGTAEDLGNFQIGDVKD